MFISHFIIEFGIHFIHWLDSAKYHYDSNADVNHKVWQNNFYSQNHNKVITIIVQSAYLTIWLNLKQIAT